jgi:transcriptional regulator GlxA family with amidase domain
MHGDSLANAAARYLFHQSLRPQGTSQNPSLLEPLGSTAPSVLKRAIKLMEENLEDALSIPQICKQVRLSQRQLDRLFAQFVRKSPVLYYRDIRLDRARSLVTQTDMQLSEVAVASGFSSQAHFSRAYRERFGLAPRTDRVEGRVPFEFRAWPMHRKKRLNER